MEDQIHKMRLTSRHSDLFNIENQEFHAFGCGGIGSWAIIQLAKMGATNFVLYDRDTVEPANVGVSAFDMRHIGKNKVEALREMILDINPHANIDVKHGDADLTALKHFANSENNSDDKERIALMTFDNMQARREVGAILCAVKIENLLDARMGSEALQMYVFKNPQLSDYMKYWYPDGAAAEEPCAAKATSYCSVAAGAFLANSVKRIVTDGEINEETTFHFPTMTLTSQSAGVEL